MIVSKVGEEFVDGQSVFDFSATHTRRSVERSLKRLETERIELVLVHSDGNDLDILENSEVYPTLAALKREGLIGAYGLSGKTVEGGLRALREGDCAMVTYNLNERAERPVIEYAAAHAKGILVKKALASGHACLGAGQDPVRASFELVFDQPGVAAAIVGTINPLHLAHNVAMAAQALKRPEPYIGCNIRGLTPAVHSAAMFLPNEPYPACRPASGGRCIEREPPSRPGAMTRQGAPYAPYARPQGSVRLQDPAAAGGGLPGRAGLPGPRPAAELPADARTPPPHGGSRPAALRRRAGQPGVSVRLTLNWQGRDYWVLVRQRRLDRGDTVLKLISGYVPAHELNLPLLTAIQEVAEECLVETAGGWLGGRFGDTWLPTPYQGSLRYRENSHFVLTPLSGAARPVQAGSLRCWSAHAPTYTCPRPRCNWSTTCA